MILDDLAESTRKRIEAQKKLYPYEYIKRDAEILAEQEIKDGEFGYRFEDVLKKQGLSIIAEVKKA